MEELLDWIRKRRKVTVLLVLTLVAYSSAINRVQPFMWIIPALLSATLIIGVAWPRWLIRHLDVRRSGPSRAAEGETIQFQVVVENRGWLPRFMIEIVDHLPFAGQSAPDTSARKILGMLAYLPGRQNTHIEVAVVCEKRGHYQLGPVGLASSFPLGLTEARASHGSGKQTLTIYPTLFPIVGLPLKGAPSQIHRGGYLLPEGSGEAEFCGLREYRRGDNPRHIHWPTTAKLNELMVREYEPLAAACLYLLLDQATESNVGAGRQSTFEYSVRIAASIARTACMQNIRTRIAGAGRHSLRGAPGAGDRHFQGILDTLAVVAADGETPYERLLMDTGPLCVHGETAVVFLSEPGRRWPATLQALATLRARQVNLLAIVFDSQTFIQEGQKTPLSHLSPGVMTAALLAIGAHCITVRRGDDLVRLFNT